MCSLLSHKPQSQSHICLIYGSEVEKKKFTGNICVNVIYAILSDQELIPSLGKQSN